MLSTAITVDLARTEAEWRQGLKLVDTVYQRTYDSHWHARPDVLLLARDDKGPVATTAGYPQ
jgi:hypothetical protein